MARRFPVTGVFRSPRVRAAAAGVLFLAIHGTLVAYFASELFVSLVPDIRDAYGHQAYLADRALSAFRTGFGVSLYDPFVLAGRQAGGAMGLESRGLVLAPVLGSQIGVSPARAFNAWIALVHVSAPLWGFAAARTFGLPFRAALATAAFGSALLYFDSLAQFAWSSGRIQWLMAALVTPLVLALFHRVLECGRKRVAVALSGMSAFLACVQPIVAVAVTLFSIVALLSFARRAKGRARLLACTASLAGAAVALAFYVRTGSVASGEPSGVVFRATLEQLPADYLELLTEAQGAPGGVRTFVRILCLSGAVLGIGQWGIGELRARLLAVYVGLTFAFAYLGGYFQARFPADPYLLLLPAAFASAVPAGSALHTVLSRKVLGKAPATAKILVSLVGVALLPSAARSFFWFVDSALPARVHNAPTDSLRSSFVGLYEPMPTRRGHGKAAEAHLELVRFLRGHCKRGRTLVFDRSLAASLTLTTQIPVMGPLSERGSRYAAADPSLLRLEGSELPQYLERYAVECVVLEGPARRVEKRGELFEPATHLERFRVLRARQVSSYVLEGAASRVDVAFDRIRVSGAEGPRIVLRYHHDEALRCRPRCTVTRHPLPGDPAGFVSISDPPGAFELYSERR